MKAWPGSKNHRRSDKVGSGSTVTPHLTDPKKNFPNSLADRTDNSIDGRMFRAKHPYLVAVGGLSLLCGVIFGAFGVYDWAHTHSYPIERAVVTSVTETGYTESCSRSNTHATEYKISYTSNYHTARLPAGFSNIQACDGDNTVVVHVGDVIPIVRTTNPDGSLRKTWVNPAAVWVSPDESQNDVLTPVLAGLMVGAAVGLLVAVANTSSRRRAKKKAVALAETPDASLRAMAREARATLLDPELTGRSGALLKSRARIRRRAATIEANLRGIVLDVEEH